MRPKKIVIASGNPEKIKEFNYLLKSLNTQVIPQQNFNVPEVKENQLSFVENALLKARHCAQYTSYPVLADDSGLCIPSLLDNPGIYSARYSGNHGNDHANTMKVLDNTRGLNLKDKKAYFYCAIAFLINSKDSEPIIVTGKLDGYINNRVSGKKGFGYDSIFYVPECNSTLGELSFFNKNMISHRARAVSHFKESLLNKNR